MVTPSDRELAKVSGGSSASGCKPLSGLAHRAAPAIHHHTEWRGEIELPGGEKIPFGPGHIFLMKALTGRGHIYRGLGTDETHPLVILDRAVATSPPVMGVVHTKKTLQEWLLGLANLRWV